MVDDGMPETSGVDARKLALEVMATLVNVKRIAADRILPPAGIPDVLIKRFLKGKDATTGETLTGIAQHVNTFGLGGRVDTGRMFGTMPASILCDQDVWRSWNCTRRSSPSTSWLTRSRTAADARAIILDPFGGSGTTMVAAQKSGRLDRLIEYDPAYCDVILRRFEAATGTFAILARTGQSF